MNEWIRVEDRLPEGDAVIYWDGQEVSIFFPGTGKDLSDQAAARCQAFGITHWMPMPEPPKQPKDSEEKK